MRARLKTTAVIGVLLALALAMTGPAAAPAMAKHAKHKKVKNGPIPPDFFGIIPLSAPTAGVAQQMSTAGVESVRLFSYWGLMEPQPGVYNWSSADAVIQNVAAAGLTPAIQFANVPSWISSDPNRPPIYSSSQISAWQAFLANFMRRYGAHGSFWAAHPSLPYHPTTSIEIWNEPNLKLFWGGTPNPRDYLRLLKISKAAIRGVDPSAQIVFGGLFPFPMPQYGMKALKFLNKFYRGKGAKKSFNVLSLHPYSYTPKPARAHAQVVPQEPQFPSQRQEADLDNRARLGHERPRLGHLALQGHRGSAGAVPDPELRQADQGSRRAAAAADLLAGVAGPSGSG